ncbi:hypothetical protein KR009_000858 [Drosophila setifemur]|nr:hypothetical protein KR009_000858 [Drosophila setifemur]
MRPKEYPELFFDEIPKLYEARSKVLLTSLVQVHEQLQRLPRKFCRMYTTKPLASQLLQYLRSRQADVSDQDFQVVEEGKPFHLRLSDGKRLDVMLCSGSYLGHSLVLLIRRPQGGPLLYFYSAVRLDNFGRLLGNFIFNSWIAQNTEKLFINLSSVNRPFEHVDFDKLAAYIEEYRKEHKSLVLVELPLFGYEELVWRLGHTKLHGQIRLLGDFAEIYTCLSTDLKRFERGDYETKVHICAALDWSTMVSRADRVAPLPLEALHWTPQPTRMHLRQLCSLLRPQYINGIMPYQSPGNLLPVPSFLQCFRATFSPPNKTTNASLGKESQQANVGGQTTAYRVIRAKRFKFVDDEDDSSNTE